MEQPGEPIYIPEKIRAALHMALARGIDAGMSADRTVTAAAYLGNKSVRQRMVRAGKSIRKGQSYTATLYDRGLLTAFDYVLLRAGEESGQLGRMHMLLSRRYESRHLRNARLRARMLIPIITAVLGLFILPLPELIGRDITVTEYFIRSAGVTIMLAIFWHTGRDIYRQYNLRGWPEFLTRLPARIPRLRKWLLQSARALILKNLATLLEAGLPLQQALRICADNANNDFIRQLVERASAAAVSGTPVAITLADTGLIDEREGYALVSAGEAAGRLVESLERHAAACEDYMDRLYDRIGKLTPIIIYFIVAAFIVKYGSE
jgi:type II secretory pathway component PulF